MILRIPNSEIWTGFENYFLSVPMFYVLFYMRAMKLNGKTDFQLKGVLNSELDPQQSVSK